MAGILTPATAGVSPLDYLHGAGSRADFVVPLTWGVLLISIAVIIIISALVVGAIWRRPAIKRLAGEKIPLEPDFGAMNWIWIGVSLSTIVLLVSVVWTMAVLAQVDVTGD